LAAGGFGGGRGGGGFGGLPPGFGGMPFGRQGGPGGRRGGPQMPQNVTVTGDVWLSDMVKLPSSDKQVLLPLLREIMPGGGPLLLPFAGAVAKTHELPLLAKVTLTPTPPPVPPMGQGNDNSAAPPPAHGPMVATLTVTSVSSAALDASLFAVPQGYTQSVPPRSFGGRGRGPGMFPGGPGPSGGMPGGPPPPDGGMDGAGPPQAL
jgi:hypothetical protein